MQVENFYILWICYVVNIYIKKCPNFCIEKNFDYNCIGKYYF